VKHIQIIGLLLWRGGLLLVAGTVVFEVARLLLRLVALPVQLEIGFGLVVAGGALVLISLILERIQDLRIEGNLRE
jgi:hypothetical protein